MTIMSFVWILEDYGFGDLRVFKTKSALLKFIENMNQSWFIYKDCIVYATRQDWTEGNDPLFYIHKELVRD